MFPGLLEKIRSRAINTRPFDYSLDINEGVGSNELINNNNIDSRDEINQQSIVDSDDDGVLSGSKRRNNNNNTTNDYNSDNNISAAAAGAKKKKRTTTATAKNDENNNPHLEQHEQSHNDFDFDSGGGDDIEGLEDDLHTINNTTNGTSNDGDRGGKLALFAFCFFICCIIIITL